MHSCNYYTVVAAIYSITDILMLRIYRLYSFIMYLWGWLHVLLGVKM